MKSMEEMMAAAQQAAETIQKQMNEMQVKLDGIELKAPQAAAWSKSAPAPKAAFWA
jgi:hypothetical protein